MLAISVFIAVIVINMGGYIDNVARGEIAETIGELSRQLMLDGTPEEARLQIVKRATWDMEENAGFHAPFLLRCAQWWYHAIIFDWGETNLSVLTVNTSPVSDDLRTIIAERLSITLLLAGASNLIIFTAIIAFSLFLSRRNGSWLDKLMRALSPLSAAPNWVYGLIFIAIFATGLRLLPAGNLADGQSYHESGGWLYLIRYVQTRWEFFLNIAKHMILPVLSIFMATFFQGVFVWRTFFLIYSEEDYVEMAKAKGVPTGLLERKYILRPTLPPIMTNLAMMLVGFWEGAIALEVIFNWPGIGYLFWNSGYLGGSIRLSVLVLFAYLLAISVLLLEIAYAVVDPRISLTSSNKMGKIARKAGHSKHDVERTKTGNEIRTALFTPFKINPKKLFSEFLVSTREALRPVRVVLKELQHTTSGKLGFLIIAFLFILSIAGVFINWKEMKQSSYGPPNAVPVWVNLFRKVDLPGSIYLDTVNGTAKKIVEQKDDGTYETQIEFVLEYPYTVFPDDVTVVIDSEYQQIRPKINMIWLRPDGGQIDLLNEAISHTTYSFYNVLANKGRPNMWGIGYGVYPPMQTLFEDKSLQEPTPLQGTYKLLITGTGFEADKTLDAHLIIPGSVYGIAGTDGNGTDMALLLLACTPLTLLYGILGAVGVNLGAMLLAAMAATFGGWVDNLIQRLTEIKMLLPAFPLALMIAVLYTNNTWIIMGILILINVFGSVLKEYRAIFLQTKETIYVEAARAYGASKMRIVFHYLLPRVITMLIPQLVIGIPAYSFMQATLTFLMGGELTGGITWGGLLAVNLESIRYGYIHLTLEPAILLFLLGLGFALIGFNLEAILNPRLRKY